MVVMTVPDLLDAAAKNKTTGKVIERWLQEGASKTNLQVGSPVYKALMDIGAKHYSLDNEDE